MVTFSHVASNCDGCQVDRALDDFGEKCTLDPEDVPAKNLVRAGPTYMQQEHYESC